MANNRLYIYDPENNSAFMLAKTMGSGWYVQNQNLVDDFERWLDENVDWSNMEAPRYILSDEYHLPNNCSIFSSKL